MYCSLLGYDVVGEARRTHVSEYKYINCFGGETTSKEIT